MGLFAGGLKKINNSFIFFAITPKLHFIGAKSLASSLESWPPGVAFGLSSSSFLLDARVQMKGCTRRGSVIKCQTLVALRYESASQTWSGEKVVERSRRGDS